MERGGIDAGGGVDPDDRALARQEGRRACRRPRRRPSTVGQHGEARTRCGQSPPAGRRPDGPRRSRRGRRAGRAASTSSASCHQARCSPAPASRTSRAVSRPRWAAAARRGWRGAGRRGHRSCPRGRLPSKDRRVNTRGRRPGLIGVVDEDQREAAVARLDGHQPVGVARAARRTTSACGAVTVHRGPRGHRPAVVELPDDRARVARAARSGSARSPNATARAWFSDMAQCQSSIVAGSGQVPRRPRGQLEVAVLGLLVARASRAPSASAVRRGRRGSAWTRPAAPGSRTRRRTAGRSRGSPV